MRSRLSMFVSLSILSHYSIHEWMEDSHLANTGVCEAILDDIIGQEEKMV